MSGHRSVPRLLRAVAAVLAVLGLAGACSIETAGAPGGKVTLYATFDDVQDLTPGHNVQASNVVVGSVRGIELDGYQARVEMSIVDDFQVPQDVSAVVRRTSLLGEYYVDLVLPETFDPDAGPFLADGDLIADASTQPDVEQLAEQAASVVGALTADDLGATVGAAAEGLGGRGDVLNQLIKDAGLVSGALADQQSAIAATVDNLAALGADLAPRADKLAAAIDQLATASGTIADNRDKLVATVDALVELATATNDSIIEPHAERLAQLLEQLQPILGTLVDEGDVLVQLIVDLDRFVEAFPSAVHNGSVLLLAWAYVPGALADLSGSLDGTALGFLTDALEQLGLLGGGG